LAPADWLKMKNPEAPGGKFLSAGFGRDLFFGPPRATEQRPLGTKIQHLL